WAEAVGQTLLSLSLAAGIMPTFAKTMPDGSTYLAAFKIVAANFIGCVTAALSVCPFCYGLSVEGGISCAFTVYPQVVYSAALSGVGRRVLGVCVYGALTSVSVHSFCSLATPLLSKLKNAKISSGKRTSSSRLSINYSRPINYSRLSVFIFCALSAILAPVFSLNGCEALSCCDRVACCVSSVLIAFAECLSFAKRGEGNVLLRLLIKFVCPVVCGVAAFLSICSARFIGFGLFSLCMGALAASFPVAYALTPFISKLKNQRLKSPPLLDK
ncbi:MAG: hypothetical protein ACI4QN_05290, partial [Candidatus Coproplasma sp.]